jgi:hypothetical protein
VSDADEQKQLGDLRRLAKATSLSIARRLRAGEVVSPSEVDKLARLEVRISTLEQFFRLRDLTRQPGIAAPLVEAVATRAKRTKRKKTDAARTKTKTD